MSPTTLSYNELKEELIKEIQKHQHGVLATSDGNSVTAREMMILVDGLTIFCFTASHTRKYKQMQVNKNVAFSINNLQIEGTVTLRGHPSNKGNAGFLKMFEETYPKSYEFWGPICTNPESNFQLIEISPMKITAYKSADGNTFLDILNLITETATRAYLDDIDYERY